MMDLTGVPRPTVKDINRREVLREAVVFVAMTPYSPVMRLGCLRALRTLIRDPGMMYINPGLAAVEFDAQWHNGIDGMLGDLYIRFEIDPVTHRVVDIVDVWLTQHLESEHLYFEELEKGA